MRTIILLSIVLSAAFVAAGYRRDGLTLRKAVAYSG